MSNTLPGYGGYTLEVDLSNGELLRRSISQEIVKNFIGGKGIGSKILYEELSPNTDPFSSKNILVIANGPLTGTLAPTSSRCVVSTKSPLTGLWLDSNSGGSFGPELKFAGIDILKIRGQGEKPCYLLIEDERVSLQDASDLWGKDTITTHQILQEQHPCSKVACIGPAGEKGIPMSCIQSEGRSFGRGGAGAVLGSKKLKAIVVRGTGSVAVYDYLEFLRSCREAFGEMMLSPDTSGSRNRYGTNSIYSFIQEAGVLPINNFGSSNFPGMENINEHALVEELFEQDRACFACPIACSKYSHVKDGKYKGAIGEGPEYENTWSFGPQCGNSDKGCVLKAEYLCDCYGIDGISTGNAIGFLMECYERGLLTEADIGFCAPFGDDEAIIKLVHMIGKGEGIGELLGQGVMKASQKIGKGSEHFAMQVKGMELPAYEPRGSVGMGLAFATSDRGACHLRAWSVGAEVLDTEGRLDPLSSEHKAELVKTEQDWFSVIDSIGICLFANFGLNPNQLTKLLYSVTGIKDFSSLAWLIHAGEKIYNLTRLFNYREGVDRQDDMLPSRLLQDPSPHPAAKGNVVPLEEMLSEYYLIRGWDQKGIPSTGKLEELGLSDYAFES